MAQQEQPPAEKPKPPAENKRPPSRDEAPPEEDEASMPREYTFNPLQAQKELTVGKYHLKTGKYKAAQYRFQEATKWNPGLAEAYLMLGEAEEKLRNKVEAKQAYGKYLELAPEAKDAAAVKKKMEKL